MLQCNLKFEENLDEAKFEALITRLRTEAASGSGEPAVEPEPAVVPKIISYVTNE
jgi:hypothetical protein